MIVESSSTIDVNNESAAICRRYVEEAGVVVLHVNV